MIILYLLYAFVAFLIVFTGPSRTTWRAAVVRLAGIFAFPLSLMWLWLPWGVRFTAYRHPTVSQREAEQWSGLVNAFVAFGAFALFVVTIGLGLICLSYSQAMNKDLAAQEAEK